MTDFPPPAAVRASAAATTERSICFTTSATERRA